MNVERVLELLRDCVGEVDDDKKPLPGTELVDVWMLIAMKPEKVRQHEAEMIGLLNEWPSVSWGQPVPPLGEEINYITAGAVLGSQGTAFLLFAFGKLLGWWQILDPASMLGLDKNDSLANEMARKGMIAIQGYKPSETSPV